MKTGTCDCGRSLVAGADFCGACEQEMREDDKWILDTAARWLASEWNARSVGSEWQDACYSALDCARKLLDTAKIEAIDERHCRLRIRRKS